MMPQLVRNKKNCLMCAYTSIERKAVIAGRPILLMTQSATGVNCGICNRFCCSKCLQKVVSVFPNEKKKNNHWYMFVMAFISEEKQQLKSAQCYPAGPFVGHCCELRFLSKRATITPLASTRFDGCLFLPEYKLIINPAFSSDGIVDIHGFGGYAPYFTGVVHCVPSHTSCMEYERKGVVATGSAARFRKVVKCPVNHHIRLPYEWTAQQVCELNKEDIPCVYWGACLFI
jgi:hypothetical protein